MLTLIENEEKADALLRKDANNSAGRAWWGEKDKKTNDFYPITDEPIINDFLAVFGIKPFGDTETGTSIIIPYIDTELLMDEAKSGLKNRDPDTLQRCTFANSISDYLKYAVQKWYAPIINNFKLKKYGRKFLNVYVNGPEAIQSDEMYPIFKLVQDLYSLAYAKSVGANAVLLAGTGTIAVAFDDKNRKIISGGWGMNIGDGGSGYYIGLEALKRSLSALDKTSALTPLQQEITGLSVPISPSLDAEKICCVRDEVRKKIFPLDRKHIASYAKTVVAHCELKESDALNIINDAGVEMAMLCVDCINKLSPFKVNKIAVSGGLVNVREYWQSAFEDTINNYGVANKVIYKADGILLGTQLLAVEQAKYKEV
jgi:N-acetylglucosamine kinase-like BadF-type ATPase